MNQQQAAAASRGTSSANRVSSAASPAALAAQAHSASPHSAQLSGVCEAEEPPSTEPPNNVVSEVGNLDAEPPSTPPTASRSSVSPVIAALKQSARGSTRPPSKSSKSSASFSTPLTAGHAGGANCNPTSQSPGRRHPFWKDIPDELWQDWRWQRANAVKTAAQLAELLPLPPEEIAGIEALESKYRTAIPPYYFSLIDTADENDPIRLQSVPQAREDAHESGVELDDPLEEDKDSPVPGVTHRYPDRALLITTPVCSMYCRFCTRKRVTMDRDGWDAPSRDEERMIEYVRDTEAIRDVIVSGGDPLTLPVAKLRWFISQLAAIEHVDVIRIGTRVPVTLPQRLFDPELIDLLSSAGKIWIQTHFNHPREITPESERACRALVNAGMPVNNHAVLMRGVNDSVETMRELVRGLLRIKVRPYYLFHCDPVTGAGHFRTSIWKGIEIVEGLRGHVSGLGVPTYVVDGLHGAGKIPVMPNYLLSSSDDGVILRNYEGMIFRYAPEDKPRSAPEIKSQGVSRVLSGDGKPIVPTDSPRQLRRKKVEIVPEPRPAEPAILNSLPIVELPTHVNGHSTEPASSNDQPPLSNGKQATSGKQTASGKHPVNGVGKNGAPPRRIAAQRLAIDPAHDLAGPTDDALPALNGYANGHSTNGHSASGQAKRRATLPNSTAATQRSTPGRRSKPLVHLDVPALKSTPQRRPKSRNVPSRKPKGRRT